MIKFIEVQNKHEIGNGILDFLVKVVGTENGEEYSEEKNNHVALLVNFKYDIVKKIIVLSNEALIYKSNDEGWVFGYHIDRVLQSEIREYFLKEMETNPREYTTEEIRDHFLKHVWDMVEYWEKQDHWYDIDGTKHPQSYRRRMEGLAFSILNHIDGNYLLAPCPDEEDKDYHIEQGENYYPYNVTNSIKGDIAGGLHDLFYPMGKERVNKAMKS